MKLISARASRAPGAISTVNRAPAIFVPRSKSRMPSAGPRSQCGFGSKSSARGSPTRRISRVVVGALADRHARVRDVGNQQQQVAALVLERLERGVLLLDLLAAGAVGVHQRGDVFAGLLPFRHFRGRRVLIALEVLHLDDEGATAFVERAQRVEQRVGVHAAIDERRADKVRGGLGRTRDRA